MAGATIRRSLLSLSVYAQIGEALGAVTADNAAPSPRRVRIFAAEKAIKLDVVPVDLAKGEQMSAKFRRLNPECAVPVLELEDGTCIT